MLNRLPSRLIIACAEPEEVASGSANPHIWQDGSINQDMKELAINTIQAQKEETAMRNQAAIDTKSMELQFAKFRNTPAFKAMSDSIPIAFESLSSAQVKQRFPEMTTKDDPWMKSTSPNPQELPETNA